jgi:hypothetical protein
MVVRSLKEIPENVLDDDDQSVSTIQLVRMVNHIPLLDSAEAAACGVVHGLQNKDLWGSFGLRVQDKSQVDSQSWTPAFELHDSDQLAPFFRIQNHKLWEQARQREDTEEASLGSSTRGKRKRGASTLAQLMPAKVRMAKILIVVNIQAAPTSLPLPSLSKVINSRFPEIISTI